MDGGRPSSLADLSFRRDYASLFRGASFGYSPPWSNRGELVYLPGSSVENGSVSSRISMSM